MITIIWSYRRNPVELAASCQTFGSCDLLQTFSDQSRQESPALRILRMKLTSTISTMIIIVIIAIVCLQIWEALCGRLFVLPARLKWNWYFACVIVVLYEKHKYEGRRARQLKTLTGGRREHAATVSWSVRIRCEYRVWAELTQDTEPGVSQLGPSRESPRLGMVHWNDIIKRFSAHVQSSFVEFQKIWWHWPPFLVELKIHDCILTILVTHLEVLVWVAVLAFYAARVSQSHGDPRDEGDTREEELHNCRMMNQWKIQKE